MFLFLKAHFLSKSSCCYEYTPEKIASIIDVSPNTARSIISRFIKYGWCRKHRGFKGRFKNLIFIHTGKFQDNVKDSLLINFKIKGGCSDILDSLYLVLLRLKQAQFNKIKQSAHDVKYPTNLHAFKEATRFLKTKNFGSLPDKNAKLQISIKTIAEWFNCSVGKASQIIKRLRQSKQIIVEGCRQIIATFKDKKLASAFIDLNSGCYYSGIHVIKVSCNYYQF